MVAISKHSYDNFWLLIKRNVREQLFVEKYVLAFVCEIIVFFRFRSSHFLFEDWCGKVNWAWGRRWRWRTEATRLSGGWGCSRLWGACSSRSCGEWQFGRRIAEGHWRRQNGFSLAWRLCAFTHSFDISTTKCGRRGAAFCNPTCWDSRENHVSANFWFGGR